MKSKRLRLAWLFIVLALGAIAALIWLSGQKPVPSVETQTVVRADLSSAILTNGKVEPVTPYEMRALIQSHVTKIDVTEGQSVKKGQLLVELDEGQLRGDVSRAREELATNQENLRVALAGGRVTQLAQLDSEIRKTDIERTRLQKLVSDLEKLVSQQAATQQELIEARANLTRADADHDRQATSRAEFVRQAKLDADASTLLVAQSKETLNNLQEKLNSTRIVAPADGTLYALPMHVNDPVKDGDLIAAVADLRHVRVRAFVDEPDLGYLAPGQNVVVTWDALPGRTWTGRTAQVPRQVVAHGTRTVGELLCPVNNDDQRLIPNTNVNVRIALDTRTNVLVIPRGAVAFEGSRRSVYVVESGTSNSILHKREVELGISDSTRYEVKSGLKEGDVIALLSNIDQPADGMKVRVQAE
jgi:HlyD family secretion protein